jgi:hypothetical protein
MSRQNFNSGQEILSTDLNSLQGRLERGFVDRLVYELIQRKTNGFFKDGFKAIYSSATEVNVSVGLGLQSVTTTTKEPNNKLMVLDAVEPVTISAAHATLPRIDIISVKYNRADDESENRRVKDEFTEVISTDSVVVSTEWAADVLYTEGTANVSPTAPATPAGYLKIAEVLVSAATGVASQASITDTRTILPMCNSNQDSGSLEYDAVVGNTSTPGVTHANLKAALDASSAGWKILVTANENIDDIPVVSNNNIEIVFKRGVTFTKGLAGTGLQISGDDCKVVNARMKDFISVGNEGILIDATAARTCIIDSRFNNCADNIIDSGTDTYVNISYTE